MAAGISAGLFGASHLLEEEKRRTTSRASSAEGALLAGAGLLGAAAFAPNLAICADEKAEPSFDCQAIKKVMKGR